MSLSGVMKMTQKYAKFGGFAADTHPRPASHSFRASKNFVKRPGFSMEERTVTGLPGQIRLPGIGRGVPSFASWLATRS